jgi:hypothetical protein
MLSVEATGLPASVRRICASRARIPANAASVALRRAVK